MKTIRNILLSFCTAVVLIAGLLCVSVLYDQYRTCLREQKSVEEKLRKTRESWNFLQRDLKQLERKLELNAEQLDQTVFELKNLWTLNQNPYEISKRLPALYAERKLLEARYELQRNATRKLDAEIGNCESELNRIGKNFLIAVKGKWAAQGIAICLFVLFFLFVFPFLKSLIQYYVFAALAERFPPAGIGEKTPEEAIIQLHPTRLSQLFDIPENTVLYIRGKDGEWIKKRENTKSRTRLIWNHRYPLVSFAADLLELVEYRGKGKHSPGRVWIGSPYPDLFLKRIDLNGTELVIRPKALIGLTSGLTLRTRWSFGWRSILAGRIRRIILAGHGTVFLAGGWGVEETRLSGKISDCRIERPLLLAYTPESEFSLCRTETFWHYWRSSADLFDLKLHKGLFITQNNALKLPDGPRKRTAMEKLTNTFLNGIGSLFGF